jgi:similar to stage IV sporulation protein
VLPLVLLGILIWSSFYVWQIEVSGNETVPTEEIRNALEECGVRIGAFWPAFKSDGIRSHVLVEIPKLKWLSVSVSGSRAVVVVRETTPEIKPFDEKQAVRLVAALPGYIDEMQVCRGFSKFEKGQAALTGDTLADGAVPDALGGVRFVHARGEVIAETYRELTAELPLTAQVRQPTGRARKRVAVLLGEKRINFYVGSRIYDKNCDTIIKVHKLGVKGLFELPVSFVTETDRHYSLASGKTAETAAKQRLQKQLEDELRRSVGADGKIESAECSFETVNGWELATLRARCRQNIAREQPMTAAEIAEAQAAAKPKEEKKTE